jgi:hypothetical protein
MLVALSLLQSAAALATVVLTAPLRSPRLTESSGVAVSRAHPGIVWTHNDSGDGPYLYATDLHGSDRGAIRVSGAAAVDWEDMALGSCPSGRGECIYLADTGDNLERRTSVTIYAVVEPDPPLVAADTQRVTAAAQALRLRYPDGSHDVEALYVSPRDAALYLVTKGRSATVRLYRVDHAAWQRAAVATAELVQTLPITPDRSRGHLVTGAATRADGAEVAIRTYADVTFFLVGDHGRLKPAARPVCSVAGLRPLGEAVAFRDDSTLVLTSEADRIGPGAIHTVRCPR